MPDIDIGLLAQQSIAEASGNRPGSSSGGSRVYVGKKVTQLPTDSWDRDKRGARRERTLTTRAFRTPEQHLSDFYSVWNNPKSRTRLIQSMVASNPSYYGRGVAMGQAHSYWEAAGAESAKLASVGRYLTPWQIIMMRAGGTAGSGGSGSGSYSTSGGGGGGGGSSTTTTTSVNITDPQTAKALTDTIFQAALGREPTKDEYSAYVKALNAAERANPTTTTTTVSGSSVSSTTSGGLDSLGAQRLLTKRAERTPESQAYRTNNVFNQAMEILAGGTSG